MSTTIDHRVIQMKFDNDEFEKRASKTLSTIAELKSKMNFAGASKGLTDLNAAAKSFSLEGIGRGVEDLKNKFSTLSIVGITALTNIANKAVNAGLQVVKSLTIGPISQGFADYNTKLTSVQTIMNATGADIGVVNGYFKQLDTYSDKTIYNLSDMTGAFAKFTNAGVNMDKSVPAIKGIANMVALAGQGADAASIAMYNLSQSIAGGFLTTTDYKSLNLANVATKEWKTQLIAGAVAAGSLKKSTDGLYHIPGGKKAYDDASLFTEGLSEQWATTGVLMKVLGQYGDTTTAIGKKAQAAAQNVKSLPMMMDTLKASVGTGWTDSFEFIFGNVEESTKLFTGMTNAIQGVLDRSSFARNHMLHQWKDLGGRTAIIDSFKNAWKALGAIFKPIGDAWKAVFPPGAGKALADFSFKLREITSHMIIGKGTAENLKKTFEGIFSILKIGIAIVSAVVKGFFSLFAVAGSGTGGILSLTATIGAFITKIQEFITSSKIIPTLFDGLIAVRTTVILPLIQFIAALIDAFSALFRGDVSGFQSKIGGAFGAIGDMIDVLHSKLNLAINKIRHIFDTVAKALGAFAVGVEGKGGSVIQTLGGWAAAASKFLNNFSTHALGGASKLLDNLVVNVMKLRDALKFHVDLGGMDAGAGTLTKFGAAMQKIGNVWSGVIGAFSGIGHALSPITSTLRDFFATLVKKVTEFIKNMDMQDAVALFNTGVLILLYTSVRGFLSNMSSLVKSMNNVFTNISNIFKQLTSSLKTMQNSVRANIILKIAAAVGILTASVFTLSKIDPKALAVALGGLSTLFIELGAAMKFMTFDKKSSTSGAAALLLMATAIRILTSAVVSIAQLNTKELIKGLIGVGVLLAGLTLFAKFAEMDKGGVKAGVGLMLMATAINVLVAAVALLGNMDIGTLIKGIGSVAIMLALLRAATQGMEGTIGGAAAIVLVAGALAMLAPVLSLLGLLPYEVLLKGLGVVAIALTLLAVAANAMEVALPGAAAIAIMAASLLILAPALIAFGKMPWQNIAKAMVVLVASLTLLVIAANAMEVALPGAAAILVIAAALAILAPVLVLFGQMSWESMAKGLLMFAAVMAIIVVGLYALTPVIVVLSLFSTAIVVLGAGLLLAGAGMLLFSTALAALAVSGAAGFAVLMVGIQSFLAMLPLIAQQFGLALIAFAKVIAVAAPKLVAAFTAIIIAFLKSIQKTGPELIRTIGVLVEALVMEVTKRAPRMYAAGLDMIIGFLKAIKSRIVEITNLAIDIMVLFIKTVASRLPNIIKAGIELIISFMNGLAEGLRSHKKEIADAGRNIGEAIVEGLIAGLAAGKDMVINAAKQLAGHLPSWVKKVLGISSPSKVFEQIGIFVSEGLVKGLTGSSDQVQGAFDHLKDIIRNAKDSAAKDITDLSTKITKLKAEQLADDKAIAAQRQTLAEAQNRSESAAFAGKKATEAQRKAWEADKLKDIQNAKDKLEKLITARNQDAAAIRTATQALAEARLEYGLSSKAYYDLAQQEGAHIRQLQSLADQLEANKTKIEEANKALDDAIKTRDDYKKSIAQSFDALPDINKDTTLADYVESLQAKQENVVAFSAALDQLRAYGLSDEMYQEFLKKGVDTLPFIEEVIKGGKASVELLNESSHNLATAAEALGTVASNALYQAGVDSAQGLLDGLKSKEAELQAEMARIAAIIAQKTKDELKIKSPSQVFMKIGAFTAEGLAKGLKDNSFLAENVAGDMGQNVVDALTKTISDMSALVPMNMDMQPTITPILDLSNVKRDAAILGSMLPSQALNVESAYSRARAANAGYNANQEVVVGTESVDPGVGDVVFNQYITSPKALSTADVYRNTNNQISQAKGALTGAKSS